MEALPVEISVILSAYNSEKYIKEAIDSLLNQSIEMFELIVCDDASTDSTPDILRSYTDPRIRLIINSKNEGLTYNLNYMLTQCNGKYIARMDADDIALSRRLELQYKYLEENPSVGICGTSIYVMWKDEDPSQIVRFPKDDPEVRAFAFFQSPFTHPTVMMRKEVLTMNKLQYPPQYKKGQDYALWVEMLKYTRGANLQEPLLYFRRHEGNVSNWDDNRLQDKIAMISGLHKNYLSGYGILLDDGDAMSYSRFVDRSIPSDLSAPEQKKVSGILSNMQAYLSENHKAISPHWNYHLSMICFYNFFSAKKLPRTFFLMKMFIKGGSTYLKRLKI